jgi:two-component system copper resistance phosphate regulon response regulator CusR
MRILVVEDEKNLNRLIGEAMEDEGYSVDRCFNGLEAMEFMDCAKYDVMILDILMPRMSGLELVKKIRGRGDSTPVVFLTSLDSVEDRVAGLDGGGDYYLVKPFVMEELTAVVRVLARKSTDSRSNELSVADLTLNMTSQKAVRAGQEISLTPKEYALLEYMMRNKGIVLSREMIEDNLWNFDYEGGTNVVDVYVSFLRKKIDTGFDKKLIHTVWGTGWVMKEEN